MKSEISALLGIKINFQHGAQVIFPAGNRTFHLKVTALHNQITVFDQDVHCSPHQKITFSTRQRYYVPWQIEIFYGGKLLFQHRINLTGRPVAVELLSDKLSEILAFLPGTVEMVHTRNCRLTVVMPKQFIPWVAPAHEDINFIAPEDFKKTDFYAVYQVGVFPPEADDATPDNDAQVNLIDRADHILGVWSFRQSVALAPAQHDYRSEYGQYVVLSTQHAELTVPQVAKGAWEQTIKFLKAQNLRVFQLISGTEKVLRGAEKFPADQADSTVFDLVRNSEFFVGFANAWSYLAWSCQIPVVVASRPEAMAREFETAYRVVPPVWAPDSKLVSPEITAERLIAVLRTVPNLAGAPEHQQKILDSGIKVSVLVPTYNNSAVLRRCVDSILQQSYPNFELICSDDGSTDDSCKILQEYAQKDPRVKILRQPENHGTLINRKKLIAAATGQYCCWVDADDELARDFLAKGVSVLVDEPCDIVDLPYEVFRGPGNFNLVRMVDFAVKAPQLADFFLSGIRITPYYLWSKLIKTSVMKKVVPPDFNLVLDDVFFALPLFYFAQSYRSCASTTPVYRYYFGGGVWSGYGRNLTLERFEKCCQMRAMQVKYNVEFLRKHHFSEAKVSNFVRNFCDLGELVQLLGAFPVSERPAAIQAVGRYFGQNGQLVNDCPLDVPKGLLFDLIAQLPN